jgi:hypothetical protein
MLGTDLTRIFAAAEVFLAAAAFWRAFFLRLPAMFPQRICVTGMSQNIRCRNQALWHFAGRHKCGAVVAARDRSR